MTTSNAAVEKRAHRCSAAVSVRCTSLAVVTSANQRCMHLRTGLRNGLGCARWTTRATAERDCIKFLKYKDMIFTNIPMVERCCHQSYLDFHGPKYYGQALQNSKRTSRKRKDKKRRAKKRK